MAVSFNKRELQKKKQSKKLEKQKRKEERKENSIGGAFEDMIAYVDENGMLTDTPPDTTKKQVIDIENIAVSTPKKGEVEDEGPMKGRVEFFNPTKGFGFIKDLGSADKFFFHISGAPQEIQEGNMVTFELERGQKGMNAVRINIQVKE